jgi:GAF domain-containing protein
LGQFLRDPTQGRPVPGATLAQIVSGAGVLHVPDIAETDFYQTGTSRRRRAFVDLGGARTCLVVSLRSDAVLLGDMTIYRKEVRPFSDKQIALLQNFAAQAVIAIKNARLLGELQQRTGDLQESLEYQTATSDVLKVISGSTFDIQPVFETIVETAAGLCDADIAGITNREGDTYRMVATFAASPEYDALMRGRIFPANRETTTGRAALEGRIVHIADIAAEPGYTLPESVTVANIRTNLGVPLLRG